MKKSLLAVFFILVFICTGELYAFHMHQKKSLNIPIQPNVLSSIESHEEVRASPVRLTIPKIHIDAAIEYVGLTTNEEMDVPKNTDNVGWFALGPRPGEKGSAVLAGHKNSANGKAGVFADLDKLKVGDKLYITDNKGGTTAFVVSASRTYHPGYADDVFNRDDAAHINLITCDGWWDEIKRSYSERLVVFADIAN